MKENTFDKLMKLRKIPDAFEKWENFRHELTDFVISNTETGSAVIIGAGACNDFDIKSLAQHFSQLKLLDKDTLEVFSGLQRQSVNLENIEIISGDIVGVNDNTYRRLCDDVEAEIVLRGGEKVTEIFLESMDAAFKNRSCKAGKAVADADFCICCGVHSQLNNVFPQLAEIYSNYADIDIEKIFDKAKMMNNSISGEVNNVLFNSAECGLILGLETSREGMDGSVEGAAQAFLDIELRGIEPLAEKELLWPFDYNQNKVYNMKLIRI